MQDLKRYNAITKDIVRRTTTARRKRNTADLALSTYNNYNHTITANLSYSTYLEAKLLLQAILKAYGNKSLLALLYNINIEKA
jgi:hypothetical protein